MARPMPGIGDGLVSFCVLFGVRSGDGYYLAKHR